MLRRLGEFFMGPVDRALQWILPPSAPDRYSPEGIEMKLLTDARRQTYATVSFEDLQAAAEREDRARATASAESAAASPPSPSPPLWLCALRAALGFLARPFKSEALRRAYVAEQRFMYRRVCSRFQRVLWIGRASLFWGMLLTFVSSCGVVLALTGDLGKLMGGQPMKSSTYLMSYFTALHVAQVICAILLLIAVKMAEMSPPRLRDPTEEELLLWFFSLGLRFVTRGRKSREVSLPSENLPASAPLPDSSPERPPVVLQVQAQVEHNPDGQTSIACIRSPSVHTREHLSPKTSSSTLRTSEEAKCLGSPSGRTAGPSTSSSAVEEGTTPRKPAKESSLDAILQSLMEELNEDTVERSTDKPESKRVSLRAPWLWLSAVTVATYTITAVALYCAGRVAIPTTLCATIVLATPCILDVLAEVLGVSERVVEDLERLFGTGSSYESAVDTSRRAATTSAGAAQGDRVSPDSLASRLDEATCLLRFKESSSD